jgi:arabinogalactan oligomer/maltooligosaccharide transport system permease protein
VGIQSFSLKKKGFIRFLS